MKTQAHNKIFRDQSLFKDIGFLMLATAFVMIQGFGMSLENVALYAPAVVLAGFAGLVSVGYTVVLMLRLLERMEIRLGMRRGAKH